VGRPSEKVDGKMAFCIYGDHWTKDWKLKQHYCDPHWREYRRKQRSLTKHKALFIARQQTCPICQRDLSTFKTGSLHVDHAHDEAFTVRGLLCVNCNSILGHARDNTETLERAIDYLKNRDSWAKPLEQFKAELAGEAVDYEALFPE
jgi:hypothetical protein